MHKLIFLLMLWCCTACQDGISQGNGSRISFDSAFSHEFFSDSIFLSVPTKVAVYRNDSLQGEHFNSQPPALKVSTALLEDKRGKKFSLKVSTVQLIGDTTMITFHDLASNEKLELKIFQESFWVNYNETLLPLQRWFTCNKQLTLNSKISPRSRILGFLDVSFSSSNSCNPVDFTFTGPFYFEVK